MWFWLIIAIILGIGVLIGLIPIDAVMDLNVHGKPSFNAKIKWFSGTVTLQPGGEKTAKPEKPKLKKRQKRKTGFAGFFEMLEILQTKGLMNEFKRLVVRLIRCFKVQELRGAFRAGLPDPAYTGMLYGLFMAATVPFQWPFMRNVQVSPVFDGSVFEGDLHAVVRVRPISLAIPPVLFFFSLPVLRVLKILVVTKWRTGKSGRSECYPSAALRSSR